MSTSLTSRFIVWSLALVGATFVTTIGLSNRAGRQMAIAAAGREATHATDAAALAIEGTLRVAEESAAALARAVLATDPTPETTARLVQRFADENRQVARYAVLGEGESTSGWARAAVDRGTGRWTEPYRDSTLGGVTVITYAIPIAAGGRPARVIAASLQLDFLSDVLRNVRFGQSGYALVATNQGLLVAHSLRDLSGGTYDPLATLSPADRALVEPIVRRAQAGENGFGAIAVQGRRFRLTIRPVARTGWVVASMYAEDELLRDVSSLWRTQAALAIAGLVAFSIAIVLLSRRITRPLGALAASAGRLATGDLDGAIPDASSRDEIGTLTAAFRNMRDALKEHIRNLQETTAAKERLEAEMRAARRIQTDMLPADTAGSPSAGYELSAVLVPARAVGGDLFDHFEDDRRVFFLVGDVSGKGVAAALFMARAKTLFDGVAAAERDPGAVLTAINRSLCRQNDAGMYVTAVCGVLDVDDRTVTFATAGHDAPLIVRSTGQAHPLQAEGGRVLGLIDAGSYPVERVRLAPGDALLIFTDGVSEAQNLDGDFFGAERLLDAASARAGQSPAILTAEVLHAVKSFAATAPQSDDITILTLGIPGSSLGR